MKTFMFLVMFLLIGAFFIISNEEIKLDNQKNVGEFFNLYGQWIDGLADNGKTVLGYVVKMEWLPDKDGSLNFSE